MTYVHGHKIRDHGTWLEHSFTSQQCLLFLLMIRVWTGTVLHFCPSTQVHVNLKELRILAKNQVPDLSLSVFATRKKYILAFQLCRWSHSPRNTHLTYGNTRCSKKGISLSMVCLYFQPIITWRFIFLRHTSRSREGPFPAGKNFCLLTQSFLCLVNGVWYNIHEVCHFSIDFSAVYSSINSVNWHWLWKSFELHDVHAPLAWNNDLCCGGKRYIIAYGHQHKTRLQLLFYACGVCVCGLYRFRREVQQLPSRLESVLWKKWIVDNTYKMWLLYWSWNWCPTSLLALLKVCPHQVVITSFSPLPK